MTTEPNTKIAKFLFKVIIILAIIGPLTLYGIYKTLSAQCSRALPTDEPPKEEKKNNSKRNMIIISILAGLTAQVMNYSYSFFRYKQFIE